MGPISSVRAAVILGANGPFPLPAIAWSAVYSKKYRTPMYDIVHGLYTYRYIQICCAI